MRLKIIAGNLAVVLLLGLAPYWMISRELRTELAGDLQSQLANDRELFERSYRLSALEFTDLVELRAASDQARAIFAGLDESSRRTRAYDVAESIHGWLADPARGGRGAPDIVVIADETGKALARNGARNVMFGKPLLPAIPSLGPALESGHAVHDVWMEEQQQKVLQTAVAPILTEEGSNVLGALIVGYDLSNGVATREGELLGREVAFVVADKVYSASTSGAGARELGGTLFGEFKNTTEAVLGGQTGVSSPWTVELEGESYVALMARLPMSPSMPIAFALLGNQSQAEGPARVAGVVLLTMLLGAIMVVAYGFIVGGYIMRPIEKMEESVFAIINGQTELRLDTGNPELGGLADRINQLLNLLTGADEQPAPGAAVPADAPATAISASPGTHSGSPGALTDAPEPAMSELSGRAGSSAQNGAVDGVGPLPGVPPLPPPLGTRKTSVAQPPTPKPGEILDDAGIALRLEAEPDADYEERVYREYLAAKEQLGENVASIPKDRFCKRLASQAAALAQKHSCRQVRFQVQTVGSQVVLRPVLIR